MYRPIKHIQWVWPGKKMSGLAVRVCACRRVWLLWGFLCLCCQWDGAVDDERQWSNRRDAEVIVFVYVGGGGVANILEWICCRILLLPPLFFSTSLSPKWAAIKLSIFTPLRPTTSPQSPVIIYLFLKDINHILFPFPPPLHIFPYISATVRVDRGMKFQGEEQ